MGAIHVEVKICNANDPQRFWRGKCLVDTGATDSLLPAHCLHEIGLRPLDVRLYELADGRRAEIGIAGAQFEFMGHSTFSTVLFGEREAEPILGLTAMESVGVEVDLRNHRLKQLPAIRLK